MKKLLSTFTSRLDAHPVLCTALIAIGLTAALVIVIYYLVYIKQSTVVQFVYEQF